MAKIQAQDDDHLIINELLTNEEVINHFRVAIFGSARTKPADPHYQQVFGLAEMLGRRGFDVVTGGGPGIMEAANAGHQAGSPDNDHAHSIGLTIQLPFEAKGNLHLDIKEHFNRFSNRLDEFLKLSNVAVITHGGIGTLLELFYVWQHTQVKHINRIPIIVIGDLWDGLMDWMKNGPLNEGTISKSDFSNLYFVHTNAEAMDLIMKANQVFEEKGPGYCMDYDKYRVLSQNGKDD